VDAAGGVQCWGQNGGKLGNGQSSDSATPVPVIGLASGVRKIALGDAHACALLEDGAVKCWGAGFYGQLGQGLQASASAPVDVIGLGPGSAKDIAAQAMATCALLTDGSARCWGNNIFGQLGDGTKNNSARPVVVVGLSDITAISGGGYHACALTADHAVKCWGANADGAVGDGTRDQQLTPVAALGLSGNVAQVSAGLYHTCVLAGDGRAKCVGADDFGQLGQGVPEYSSVPAPGGLPLTPSLRLSHDAAGPGSVITLLGEGIGQPGSALLRINGRPAALLPITPTGAVVAFMEAEGATPGAFDISVAGAGNATLTLSADWPARAAEGDGRRVRLTETLPSLYLPALAR
jgi:hypothetical protein